MTLLSSCGVTEYPLVRENLHNAELVAPARPIFSNPNHSAARPGGAQLGIQFDLVSCAAAVPMTCIVEFSCSVTMWPHGCGRMGIAVVFIGWTGSVFGKLPIQTIQLGGRTAKLITRIRSPKTGLKCPCGAVNQSDWVVWSRSAISERLVGVQGLTESADADDRPRVTSVS